MQIIVAYLEGGSERRKTVPTLTEEELICAGSSHVVQRAMDFISEHYGEDLDEGRLARSIGVSDRHLRCQFKESVEIAPMHYLACYRVERAKELIKYSNDALKAIAELCGFKSIHHFNHAFSKITGEPPGAWRRRYREGICRDVCIDPHFSNVILTRQEQRESSASA